MKFIIFILISIFFIFSSCSKKIDKEEVSLKIETFCGLKINTESIDSISYDYDFEMTDYSYSYELYFDKNYFDTVLMNNIKQNPNLIFHNDSTSADYSIRKENGCMQNITIHPKKYLIAYMKVCL
ncbi:MAG: hypothetical protein WDA08_12280 [Weeksellaceae bacterium]